MLNITNYQGNANQNHKEILPHTCQNGYCQKRPQKNKYWKNVEEKEPYYTVGENVNSCSHYGKGYEVPQNTDNRTDISSVQSLSNVWLCNPRDCSTPGFPVHHQLLELAQTQVHWVGDAIQSSHPLLSPSPSVSNLSQYQSLFQGVSSSHQVHKVLEFQLQHQSFQWIFRNEFL